MAQQFSAWLVWIRQRCSRAMAWIVRSASMTNIVGLIWIVIAAVICLLIVQDLARDVVTIEPISVPKTLSDNGYTPEVAGHRLNDALNAYARRAGSFAQDMHLAPRDTLPDFVVPKVDLSLNDLVSSIRSALHYRSGQSISGEIIFRDNLAWLRLRVDGREVYRSSSGSANPDDLLTAAAPAVFEGMRPYVAALMLFHDHPEQAVEKAEEIIARVNAEDENIRLAESDANVQWSYILKGIYLYQHQKDFVAAEKVLHKAISLNWNNTAAHNDLGNALLGQDRIDEALVQYRRANSINPDSALTHNNLGNALAKKALGRMPDGVTLGDAIREFNRSLELNRKYPLAHNNLGRAYFHQDRLDDAEREYRRAVELDPKYLSAHWNLAATLQKKRDFDGALVEYHAAIDCAQAKRDLAILYGDLGDVLRDKAGPAGKLDDAVAEFRHAIEIDPAYDWAHNNLGLILLRQEKFDDAISELRSAVEADPNNETARKNLEHALQVKKATASKD